MNNLTRVNPGDLITAERFNALIDAVNGTAVVPDASLESTSGPFGTLLRVNNTASLPTWKNNSGSSAPAYSCIRANDTTADRVEGYKPSTTFWRNYVVNMDYAVPDGTIGEYQVGPQVLVAYDTGTPGAGEQWGPKPSQYTASKGFPGLTVIGIVDSTNKWMLAVQEPVVTLKAKLAASIAKNASGNVTIYVGTAGSEAEGGWSAISAYNRTQYDLFYDSGDKTWVDLLWENGNWYIVAAQPLAMMIQCTLPSALTTAQTSKASCTVDNYFQGKSPGSTVTLYNDGFAGANAAKVYATYDDRANKYRIISVVPTTATPITSHRVDTATMKLQYKKTTIYVPAADAEDAAWTDEHTGTACS